MLRQKPRSCTKNTDTVQAYQEVDVCSHEVQLIFHALLLVEMPENEVDCRLPDGRTAHNRLPHARIEKVLLGYQTKLAQQTICPEMFQKQRK